MCVDDYQFRHFSANRQKICRRFVFHSPEGVERVFLVNISQFERFGNLCLCQILMHLSKKGLNIKDYKFYLPKFDVAIQAGDRCQVPFEMMNDKEIYFDLQRLDDENLDLYKQIYQEGSCPMDEQNQRSQEQEEEQNELDEKTEEVEGGESEYMEQEYEPQADFSTQFTKKDHKRCKEQEKTVGQALFATKKWRWIHERLNFSLKNAASFVGLSKKTLDDYFLVLRVAKLHGYDFKDNLNHRIGHLRAFIRDQPVRIKGRLPKTLTCFGLVPDPDLTEVTQQMNLRIEKTNQVQQVRSSQTKSTLSHQTHKGSDEMIPE